MCLKIGQPHSGLRPVRQGASASARDGAPPHTHFAAVIVAAGQGLRAGERCPSSSPRWRGKPVRAPCGRGARCAAGHDAVADRPFPQAATAIAPRALAGLPRCRLGRRRRDAPGSRCARRSKRSADDAPDVVLIHDAARPAVPPTSIDRLLARSTHAAGAIPVLPVVDSLRRGGDGLMAGSADRDASAPGADAAGVSL